MAVWYLPAFDLNSIGTMSAVIAGPAAGTATVATNVYAHYTLGTSFTAGGSFDAAVDTAFKAVHAGFNVGFNAAGTYTISHASTFSVTWTGTGGTNLKRALGFTSNLSGTNTYTSTVRPYYLIIAAIAARTSFTDRYEPDDVVQEAVGDDGSSYAMAKDTTEMWCDWTQAMETKAAVFDYAATAAVPYTWEQFFKGIRGELAFGLIDDGAATSWVHKLRADSGSMSRRVLERVVGDYDGYWKLNLRTRYVGVQP